MIFKERQSIYLQIAERISDEILAGTYAPGSRVPSVREYAVMIEVNLNTVMRSYDTLQSWGILEMKRGLGYFVADDAVSTIAPEQLRLGSFIVCGEEDACVCVLLYFAVYGCDEEFQR